MRRWLGVLWLVMMSVLFPSQMYSLLIGLLAIVLGLCFGLLVLGLLLYLFKGVFLFGLVAAWWRKNMKDTTKKGSSAY